MSELISPDRLTRLGPEELAVAIRPSPGGHDLRQRFPPRIRPIERVDEGRQALVDIVRDRFEKIEGKI